MVKVAQEISLLPLRGYGTAIPRTRAQEMAKIIGNNLREKRISLALTQTELADLANVTYQQIQKYESGKSAISAALLYDLSLRLNTPVSKFYQGLEIRNGTPTFTIAPNPEAADHKEISRLIRAFSTIQSKELRQSFFRIIASISKQEKDD